MFLIVSYREGARERYHCVQLTKPKLEARVKLRQVHTNVLLSCSEI